MNDNQSDIPVPWHTQSAESVMQKLETSKEGLSDQEAEERLSYVLIKALPAGLTDFLVVGALVVFGNVFGVNETDISTACTMLLAIVGFMILYHICKPLNPLRWCVWVGCIIGLLVCSIWLGDIFGIEHMSMECVMLFVLFAIVTEPTLRYGTILVEKIGGIITKRTKKRHTDTVAHTIS